MHYKFTDKESFLAIHFPILMNRRSSRWNGMERLWRGEGKSAEYPILPTTFYLAAVATSDLKEGGGGDCNS